MKTAFFSLIFIVLVPLFSIGKNRDSTMVVKTASHVLHTSGNWVISPLKWDKRDWAALGIGSAVTATSVFFVDKPVQDYLFDHRNETINKILKPMDPISDYSGLYVSAGFALYGLIAKNNYAMETALIVFEGFALNALLVKPVKMVTSRIRPNAEDDSRDPLNWSFDFNKYNSFFSGHTSTIFATASVLSYRYKDHKWVPWVSYGLATLGGVQRIYESRHWTSDVLFGALAGTATGLFVAKYNENRPFQLYPVLSPSTAGLTMIFPINQ